MITFNGVTSDSIGVIVERIPNRFVPRRRFAEHEIAGRNGNLLSVDRSFPNVTQEYEVYLSAESEGLPSVARACAEWLCSPTGYAQLTDSYDNSVFREAFLVDGFNIENALNLFGRTTIAFSCKPQKWLYTGQNPVSTLTLTNPTPFDAKPLLKATGSGTIAFNGRSITILESVTDFYIDCESMNADDNSKIYCLDFPFLPSGETTITKDSTITALEITPRWWTL